jgi:iron transport multicopper oxidase
MVLSHFQAATAAVLVGLPVVLAGVQELWWDLTFVENVNPDGLSPRRVMGINGSWP